MHNVIISNLSSINTKIDHYYITSLSLLAPYKDKNYILAKELVSNQDELVKNHNFLLKKYYYYRTILADKLNNIHNRQMPESFWFKFFNYYLFRLIGSLWIRYNKFLPINDQDFYYTVIDPKQFYYPSDCSESFNLFLSDDFYQEHH